MTRPLTADDRVSEVLARNESLVEVLAAASPHFARLRHPATRRIMARLVTIGQAARIAGLDAAQLVGSLNTALGLEAPVPGSAIPLPTSPGADAVADVPFEWPAAVQELDVREDLRAGREPFARIMAAVRVLPDDTALRVRAPFEPAPLIALLARRGFRHRTEQHAEDDWSVWFAAGDAPAETGPAPEPAALEGVVLDVRGLEPPEPMLRTLEAAERLAPGERLVHLNERVPRFLLPILDQRGFAVEVDTSNPELVRVSITRPLQTPPPQPDIPGSSTR